MKAYLAARIIFCVLLISVIANSYYIVHTVKGINERVLATECEDMERALEEFEIIKRDFEHAEKFISLTVSHDDLTNIEESFSDIIGAAKAKDENLLLTAKSRLTDALEHLGRLSGINLDSIF